MPPRLRQTTVRQTIVETLEAPRLSGVSTEDFVKFKNAREIYERRLEAKNKDEGINVGATSFRDSVDELVLGLMIRAKWIEATDVENVTESQIRECVKTRSSVAPARYDLAEIERGIQGLKLGDSNKNLETRIWELDLHYHVVLRNLGYSDFVKQQPQLAIKHIFKRVTHKQLYSRIMMTYQLQKKILKDDYAKFMVELAKEAQNIDRADAASAYDKQMQLSGSESESGYGGISRKGSRKRGRRDYSNTKSRIDKSSKGGSGSGDKDDVVRKEKGQKRPPPSCLNPRCDEHHLIKDCSKTSHEYAKKTVKGAF